MRARVWSSSIVVCLAGALLAPAPALAATQTASIVVADSDLSIGETSLVTISFAAAVSGFDSSDLIVQNGTVGAVSSSDGGTTWTATLTPSAPVTAPTNTITLANGGVTPAVGDGSGVTTSNTYAVDTQRPTATIAVADTDLKAGETSLVTIAFSERVTGFANDDLSAANGALSPVGTTDGGTTWTATLTPTPTVKDTTNLVVLNNAGVSDLAGNAGTGTTSSNNYAVDTVRPTATIAVTDNNLKAGETSLVTITFSEAVTGFANADLTVPNGTLSPVSSANNITWTATLTPNAPVTAPTNVITLDNAGVFGATGNAGAGTTSSNTYAVDTARPTATIVVTDANLAIGETSPVTITFSEAVTGFANADLTVQNGTLSTVTTTNGGVTWTATLTPTPSVTDATNVISLNLAGVADTAGNAGVGSVVSNNYALDAIRPTATIVLTDGTLAAGGTSPITVTFSEPVAGFTNADLTVPNGTLSSVSSTDGGTTWTATLTALTGITDTTNVVTLNLTGVTDTAGNAGIGTATSGNYVVDGFAPASRAAGPHLSSTGTWSISYEATDDTTVASVALFARGPGETTYVQVAEDTGVLDGELTFTGGAEGTYDFYTVATDAVGNVEPAPATPDVTTILDTTSPVLVTRMGRTPVRFDLRRKSSLPLRVHVDELSNVTFRIVKGHGATVREFAPKRSVTGLVTQVWNARMQSGRLVEAGTYRLIVVAEDLAGNQDRATVPIKVIR